MTIAADEERLRRQEALDGMLEGDGERFDKRVCWAPDKVAGSSRVEKSGSRLI